jgi:hypothetical protein
VAVLPLGFGGGVVEGNASFILHHWLSIAQSIFSLPSVAFMLQSDYG